MTRAVGGLGLSVRPYAEEDEPRVLELLAASLGGGPAGERPAEFFRWKHLENPFGPSFMLVAEDRGQIVGLRAFMRWRFASSARTLRAARAVDTATHPEHQGKGVFTRLTLEALDSLRSDIDLVFNTPNEKSLPGYLKMGWRTAGTIRVSIRVRRPIRFLGRLPSVRNRAEDPAVRAPVSAETAADAFRDAEAIETLLARADSGEARFNTPRDLSYLMWRYASAPLLDYRIVREEDRGRLEGLAIFRVRPRGGLVEATVADVIVPSDGRRVATRLLSKVARAAPVDHVTCHFPSGSPPAIAARRSGFLRTAGGMTFVVNPLRAAIEPDPADLASWALSLGDLEVF